MGRNSYYGWRPYVPVAERRRKAKKKIDKMIKNGGQVAPVEIAGRKIATTFWGDAWCKNLEAYSDYANRLPRGRTYVRNGSVMDLQIEAGCVRALVCGSDMYEIEIAIKPLSKKRWAAIKNQCAGRIDSLVELLQGSISKGVMEIVTRTDEGLFPSPREIKLNCSCPDWASMCKHVAAALYGVGARLDQEPALLFTLRGVDPTEMVTAAIDQPAAGTQPRKGRTIETDQLSSIFGVDIDMDGPADDAPTAPAPRKRAGRVAAGTGKKAAPKTVKQKPATKPAARKPAGKSTAKKTPVKKAMAGKSADSKSAAGKTATGKTAVGKTAAGKTTAKKNAEGNGTLAKAGKPAAKKTADQQNASKKPAVKKNLSKIKAPESKNIPEKVEKAEKPAVKKKAGAQHAGKKTVIKKPSKSKASKKKPVGQ